MLLSSTFLSILGIVIGLGFGIHQLLSQKKVAVSFRKKECFTLFQKDISDLNIRIQYDDNEISNYVVLFKGELTNIGHFDVDKAQVHEPVKMNIGKQFKWITVNTKNTHNNIGAEVTKLSDHEIKISWDLLKTKEIVEIEALVEVPQDIDSSKVTSTFYDSIKFNYRITNLNRIEKKEDADSPIAKIKRELWISIATLVLGLVIGSGLFFSPTSYNANFRLIPSASYNSSSEHLDTKVPTVTFAYPNDSTVLMKFKDSTCSMNIEEFNSVEYIRQITTIQKNSIAYYLNKTLGLIYFAGCMFLLIKIVKLIFRLRNSVSIRA